MEGTFFLLSTYLVHIVIQIALRFKYFMFT